VLTRDVATGAPPRAAAPVPRLHTITIDPLGDPRWGDLVGREPEASIFHHPAWLRVVHEQYRYPMAACCVSGDDGVPLAGVPIAGVASRFTGRRLVSLPFSDLCPPLVPPDASPATQRQLGRALAELSLGRGAPLEIRGGTGALPGAVPGARFHHHILRLEPDVEAVQRRFTRPQAMRGVRRARRHGLTVERRTDPDALATFYGLHTATRARLGVPTQPRRFVLRFADLFARGLGFVLLVRRGREAIAAAVFLTHHDVLTYKYGASDARFLNARPNNLLVMEAICWGCEHGMRTLDFGRTDWGHESLRAFKLAWGTEEHELRYHCLGRGAHDRGQPGAARALGAILRRSPPVASRIAGELLYRHAG
jgi:CelD/BcsL family acetyltransferase involved in cellulose biosynthesis